VFARVAPEHKLRVVQALRGTARRRRHRRRRQRRARAEGGRHRHRDGPDGTDVAREASDMVLTDDNFVSIANAVEEGRVVFDNVRKVTYFLLSTGAAAIAGILYSIAAGLPLPYVPAALLWLNVVTNGLQDVALAFEPGEPDVLDRPIGQPVQPSRGGLVRPGAAHRLVLVGEPLQPIGRCLVRCGSGLCAGVGGQAREDQPDGRGQRRCDADPDQPARGAARLRQQLWIPGSSRCGPGAPALLPGRRAGRFPGRCLRRCHGVPCLPLLRRSRWGNHEPARWQVRRDDVTVAWQLARIARQTLLTSILRLAGARLDVEVLPALVV
jgi:hypothetical protein